MKKQIKTTLLQEQGFTLVEVLVAMTILALVGVSTLALTRRGISARAKTRVHTARTLEVRQAEITLRSDLTAVVPFSLAPMRSNGDSLSFTILEPSGQSVLRPTKVTYALTRERPDGLHDLERKTSDFKSMPVRQEILTDVSSIQLQFLDAAVPGFTWVDRWTDTSRLPAAISVRITAAQLVGGLELTVPLRAAVPADTDSLEAQDVE